MHIIISGGVDKAKACLDQEVRNKQQLLRDLKIQSRKPTMTDEIQLASAYNNLWGFLGTAGEFKEVKLNDRLSLAIKEWWNWSGNSDHLLRLSYNNFANVPELLGH